MKRYQLDLTVIIETPDAAESHYVGELANQLVASLNKVTFVSGVTRKSAAVYRPDLSDRELDD